MWTQLFIFNTLKKRTYGHWANKLFYADVDWNCPTSSSQLRLLKPVKFPQIYYINECTYLYDINVTVNWRNLIDLDSLTGILIHTNFV